MTARACIEWIRTELATELQTLEPPLVDTTSLCAFVTDGRALCLLANTVFQNEADDDAATDDATTAKKLQRSLKQLSKFHALERVQFLA